MSGRGWLITFGILAVLGIGSWTLTKTDRYQQWLAEQQKSGLPNPESIAESIAAPAVNAVANRQASTTNAVTEIPAEKNIAVPFTVQAPNANWDQDHNEFCEEASVLMVGRFFQKRPIVDATDAEAGLQQLKQWELDNFGYYYDTTAAETAQILEDVYGLTVELKTNPSVTDIKQALADNSLVIAPFAGRDLGNPYYTPPGPVYHMMVFRGYTRDGKFIMNDPGTRHGEEYVYDQSKLLEVMHDWVPKTPRTIPGNGSPTGNPVVLIVSQA